MTRGTQPRSLRIRRLVRALFILAVLVVSILSLLPSRDLPEVDLSDKFEHVTSYFMLAIVGSFVFREQRLILLFVLLCAMGGVIELLQAFSPGRTPDIVDAIANGAGAAAGVLMGAAFAYLWQWWKPPEFH